MDALKDSEDSGSFSKILELVCSQHSGLEVRSSTSTTQDDTFDYRNITPLPEGEDTQTLANFFNLLSKALPIDQVNIMLQQELERRKKSMASYQTRCNEAEYLLPKLLGQEETLNLKLKGNSVEIKENDDRLKLICSEFDLSKTEQFNLENQIEQTRQNVKKLKRKLECCDKIQDNLLKLSDTKDNVSNSTQSGINPVKLTSSQTVKEERMESCQPTSSIVTDTDYLSSNSPAKSLTSDLRQLPSSSSDSISVKNEHSLSDGEIPDSESRDSSESDSDLDDTDDL